MKTQKGITLVALIITIIVLLILAIVAIRAVQGDGILGKAKESTTKYEESKIKEQEELAEYEYLLAQSNGTTQANSIPEYFLEKYYPNLKIGDYVNYDEQSNGIKTYALDTTKGVGTSATKNNDTGKYDLTGGNISTENLNWRVLGANSNGQLELISDTCTTQKILFHNIEGFINYIQILNDMCNNLYGCGTNASYSRSLKGNDVNSLSGYNPESYGNYNKKHVYKIKDDGFLYVDDIKTNRDTFKYFDKEIRNFIDLTSRDNSITFSSEYYCYSLGNMNNVELIIGGMEYGVYFLADTYDGPIRTAYYGGESYYQNYCLKLGTVECHPPASWKGVNDGPDTRRCYGEDEYGMLRSPSAAIRPVVRLKAGLTVTKDASHDGSEATKACVISNS